MMKASGVDILIATIAIDSDVVSQVSSSSTAEGFDGENVAFFHALSGFAFHERYLLVAMNLVAQDVVFCCILPLLAMTYTTKPYVPGRDEVLYGSWESRHDSHQKCWDIIVYAHTGQCLIYMTSRSEPLFEDRYLITEKWIDMDGNTCYKTTARGSFYPYDETQVVSQWYYIIRIDPEGNMLEKVCSQTDYPKEFSTVGGGCYWVYYRLLEE